MKQILTLFILAILAGCSGHLETTIPIDPETNKPYKNMLGGTVKERKRMNTPTAMSKHFADMFKVVWENQKDQADAPSAAPTDACGYLTADQVLGLDVDKFKAYSESQQACRMAQINLQNMLIMKDVVVAASGGPKTEVEAFMKYFSKTLIAVADNPHQTIQALAGPAWNAWVLGKAFSGFTKLGVAAAEAGDISVGSISVHSGDDIHGAEGEGGVPAAGPSIVTIGRQNQIGTDSARVIRGANQELATSATGNQANNSTQKGPVTSDEINGDTDFDDSDGIKF